MTKNTIGQFIAALRRANGMTQQDVADRLNVSNKAVSRWERDECAPDISVIPALAEMFGVTCDELLRGERILESSPAEKAERKEPRVEKQVRALVTRTLSRFRTLTWISMTVAVAGLIAMFGISYGFYRPVIGFAVMLLFEACAAVLAILAVSRAKEEKTDNELFETADETLLSGFNRTVARMSFWAFFLIFSAILLSYPFPLDAYRSGYVDGVLAIYIYCNDYLLGIIGVLALVCLVCRKPYLRWVTNGELEKRASRPVDPVCRKMTLIQCGLIAASGILFVIAPYFYNPYKPFSWETMVQIFGLTCWLASIGCFIGFLIKQKERRKDLILPGIRNILLIPAAYMLACLHESGWQTSCNYDENGAFSGIEKSRYHLWHPEYLWYAVICAGIVLLVFAGIEALIRRRKKQ